MSGRAIRKIGVPTGQLQVKNTAHNVSLDSRSFARRMARRGQ
jgi:hypothetical protein